MTMRKVSVYKHCFCYSNVQTTGSTNECLGGTLSHRQRFGVLVPNIYQFTLKPPFLSKRTAHDLSYLKKKEKNSIIAVNHTYYFRVFNPNVAFSHV